MWFECSPNKTLCDVSGYKRTTPLIIPTCTCRAMGRSFLKRTWRWSAPVGWTSTSSPSTRSDATSPSDPRYTAVRGGSVCAVRLPVLTFLPPPHIPHSLLSWWNPAPRFLQLVSGHAVLQRDDEDAGGVGVPPTVRVQLQLHLPWQTVGAARIYCMHHTDGWQNKGKTWMYKWRNTRELII